MLRLTRVPQPKQTLGVLRHKPSDWTCCTLELPWDGNENRRSCIPPGPTSASMKYGARVHESKRYGTTLWLPDVEGRSEILVHAGNYISDTLGCILVGRHFRDLDGDGSTDVTSSAETLEELIARLGFQETTIRIGWAERPEPAALADAVEKDLNTLTKNVSPA